MGAVVVRRAEILEPFDVPLVLTTGIARVHFLDQLVLTVFKGPGTGEEGEIAVAKLLWPAGCWQAELENLRTGKCSALGFPTH